MTLREVKPANVREALVLGGCGDFSLEVGEVVDIQWQPEAIQFVRPGVGIRETLLVKDIRSLAIHGPGLVTTDAGIVGGGFGLEGAVKGIAAATLVNRATAKSWVDTYIDFDSTRGEVLLHTSSIVPFDLRVLWSPLSWQVRST